MRKKTMTKRKVKKRVSAKSKKTGKKTVKTPAVKSKNKTLKKAVPESWWKRAGKKLLEKVGAPLIILFAKHFFGK